jgi:hypothetical protein
MGDLKQDSKSNVYDEELMAGVINFKKETDTKPTKFFRLASSTNEYTYKEIHQYDYGKYGALSMD